MSGSTEDDMIPATAGGECSPVPTAAGCSSSPPPSLVRQPNGEIATSNIHKGKKTVLKFDIITYFPDTKMHAFTNKLYQDSTSTLYTCCPDMRFGIFLSS